MPLVPEAKPIVIVISGPAGVGKTTLCNAMLAAYSNVCRAVTATTRPPRPGEVEGEHYYFLSREDYDVGVREGKFYEHAIVHGNGYGVFKCEIASKLALGYDILLNVDVQGAQTYRTMAKDDPILGPSLVTVMVVSEDLDTLRERMEGRGQDSDAVITKRLANAEGEMNEADKFDYTIESSSKEADFAELQAIYLKEKSKRKT
ncbi:MAG TPA: guanylate kinase [Opitutae bacterium]|nr:guanylate kinase [Opitutae bacterium]